MQIRERKDIDARYRWDLGDIFPTEEAWEDACREMDEEIKAFAVLDGHVKDDPEKAIRACFALKEKMNPIADYAFLKQELDNADSHAQALKDRMMSQYVRLVTAISFLEPELLELEEDRLRAIMADPAMTDFSEYIRGLLRRKPHTLPKEQEKLIAMMSEISNTPDKVFTALTSADMKFPEIVMPDGTREELTENNYSTFIHGKDREVRKQAFENLMNTYGSFGNTIAGTYSGSVRNDQFLADAYHYDSALNARMDPLEIPVSVYDNLIEVIHESLPILKEYLELRKQLMGLDELHMYDLYCPLVKDFEMELPFDKAMDLVLEGLAPMGEDYVGKLKEARDNRWMDVYPTPNKSAGAFSDGSLSEVHPYVLLNHNDNLDSTFTIAHELGHSMHSYYSNTAQPAPKRDYSLFVAEVASTCNEAVMNRHLLKKFTDKKARAYILNNFLEDFRTTCFRQTMFAEFERIVHDMASRGEPLTKESLNRVYYELNRTYYGSVCEVDRCIENEWMRIPHFYRSFYVYVYATGLCAAVTLSEKIMTEGAPAVAAYRKFLSAGCSVPPIEALKLAGIDMTDPAPLRKAMQVFRQTLDEFKTVLQQDLSE